MPKLSIITVTRERPKLLAKAMDSLIDQTCEDFEWIVINDGKDAKTYDLFLNEVVFMGGLRHYQYVEIPHPQTGFGLAIGRNLGMEKAKGEIVTYFDDDNTLKPNFVEETIAFFEQHPQINYSSPIQQRRRNTIQDGIIIKQGAEFYSPTPDCTVEELVNHQQLIDSNGFAHRACELIWNPQLRIYLDYEFFLQCVCQWGSDRFEMNPVVLLEYIQTNQGIIGSSSYAQWATELEWIIERHKDYPCLDESAIAGADGKPFDSLEKLGLKYRSKHLDSDRISGFNHLSI